MKVLPSTIIKKHLWLFIILFLSTVSYAQNIQLTGFVTDAANEPIIGASIVEKGTTNGGITDFDGHFTLSVPSKATIIISYMGYATQEIPVNGKTNIRVTLKEDTELLDEVVVIGYGTMKKSDMTGAISSVDVGELANRATTNPAEALQGKVAGVNIQKAGGYAGAGIQVKIRGIKSFGNNEPLYVIDGFPGDITTVSPQDIEAMEVLKDGAAAAIYGSVAANGVIIVTTKNGKKGDTKIDFSSYLSFTNVAKTLDVLNSAEYVQVHKQIYDNYNKYSAEPADLPAYITTPSDIDTDWQDAVLQNGLAQNYMISVRGGTDNARYSLSYNHADEKGIFIGNNYRQENARAKLNMTKGIFNFDANLAFKFIKSRMPQYSLKEMYMIAPLVPIYDESQESGFGLTNFNTLPNNRNVIADNYYIDAVDKSYDTNANIAVTINFASWLNFKTSYSYRGVHERSTSHKPAYTADPKMPTQYPINSEKSLYWEQQVFDNVLSFNKEFGKHSINAMVGSSITSEKQTWNKIVVEGKKTVYEVKDGQLITHEEPAGFLDPSFSTINGGVGGTFDGSGTRYTYNRASFFGRINYSFAGKYLLQATMRYDGSSKFGKDNRWGTFPSVALGWRISEENFFPKNTIINNLKLRASWGRLGNENALGYYGFQSLIYTENWMAYGYVQGTGANPWPGSMAPELANNELQWETTDTKNIGMDFGLFNNKLTGSLNYYQNQTSDLLIKKVLAPSAGLVNPIMNVGKIKNTGFEFEVNWNDKIRDLEYNVGLNLSTTRNRVVSLADSEQVLKGDGVDYGDHFVNYTRVGKPIGAFYLYQMDGIFQNEAEVQAHKNSKGVVIQPDAKPGDIRFKDIDDNGKIDEDDKIYSGSGIPKLEVNLNLGANYKGFDFSMLLGSAWGYKLYNGNRFYFEGMRSPSNYFKTVMGAWTEDNHSTTMPRAVLGDPNRNSRESTRFLENGNFVRCRQLQLGYSLPALLLKKIQIEKLRVYVSAENLFTITNYSGIDPEFSRSSVLNTGVDNLTYPFTKSYVVGLQLTF